MALEGPNTDSRKKRRSTRRKTVAQLAASDKAYWIYELTDMERGLTHWGIPAFRNQPNATTILLAKTIAHLRLMRNVLKISNKAFLVPLMGPSERRLFPTCYIFESIVHCFDCWPPEYDRWEKLFRRHRIEIAFFSARQSASHFGERLPEMESYWLPEAIDPTNYSASTPLTERAIDVLELGRAHADYHDEITPYLGRTGAVHVYSRKEGSLIFPSRDELVRGLATTRISVCFPSSITHPERSGDVETVTYRYFESIASGCIIVGRCPRELKELFRYNPCIEVDYSRPIEQLEEILQEIGSFQPLVDRNYRRLLAIATYEQRTRTLLDILAKRGYEVPRIRAIEPSDGIS